MKKYHNIKHNLLLYSVFTVYIIILFVVLFRTSHPERSINAVPFYSIRCYLSGIDLEPYSQRDIIIYSFGFTNLVGNIVLFVPLGVYFSLFNEDKRIWKNTLYVCFISLAAEMIQYILKMGIADIDDIILNTVGGFLGSVVYKILRRKLKSSEKVRRVIEILAPVAGIVTFLTVIFLHK